MLKLFGLPAHPLLVHAPVVVLPLTVFAAILLGFRADWRAKLWKFFAAAVVGMFISLLLAMQSGEALDDAFKGLAPTKQHIEYAETTRLLTFGFLLLTLVEVWLVRRRTRSRIDQEAAALRIERLVAYGVIAMGLIATVWMIRTGHEGAKAVWKDTKLG